MSYTATSINILDSVAATKALNAYVSGTNYFFTQGLLDSSGTILDPANATLQGVANTSLAQIVTAVQGATPAGTAIIGKVGVDQTTPGVTNQVYANINQIGANTFALGQTLAASSIPVVLTAAQLTALTTSVTLSAGTAIIGKVGIDQTSSATNGVYVISGVALPAPVPAKYTGATLTRVGNTTAYAFGQVIFSTTATGQVVTQTCQAAKATDQGFTITAARLSKSNSSTTNAIFRLHFFNQQPTLTSGDGSSFVCTSGGYIGACDITMGGPNMSVGAFGRGTPSVGYGLVDTPVTGTNYVYVAIEARAAYTPVSGEVFTPVVEVQ